MLDNLPDWFAVPLGVVLISYAVWLHRAFLLEFVGLK